VLLHNVHRNARAPECLPERWRYEIKFVHEIDVSRWLTGSEMVSVMSPAGRRRSADDHDAGRPREIVSTELYERRPRLSCPCRTGGSARNGRAGAISAHDAQQDRTGGGLLIPTIGFPRFARPPNRRQLTDWISAVTTGTSGRASAWDAT